MHSEQVTGRVAPSSKLPPATVGSLFALSAGAVWSFGAILARVADRSDTFQYLIWRSVGIVVVIELLAVVQGRPLRIVEAFTSGRRMMAANLMLLLASLGFVYAVKTTSAANAAFLGSMTPLFGVIVARIFLGERINRRTGGAIALAFCGLVIMVIGDLEVGSMVGDLAALSAAVGFACYTAIVRSAPRRDWAPVLPGYAVMMVVICGVVTLANGKTFVPPAGDLSLALLHGGLFVVGGTLLYNSASKSVPAAAMTVFAQTEMVLVPVWAFVVLAELPETAALIGGTVIMVAVVGKAVLDARAQAETAPAALIAG
jgi:drug/metabolite transporter (DMT)-like permease